MQEIMLVTSSIYPTGPMNIVLLQLLSLGNKLTLMVLKQLSMITNVAAAFKTKLLLWIQYPLISIITVVVHQIRFHLKVVKLQFQDQIHRLENILIPILLPTYLLSRYH